MMEDRDNYEPQQQHDDSTWSVLGAVLAGLAAAGLVALVALMIPPAGAEEIPMHMHKAGDTTIRLMRGPCKDPRILEMIVIGMPSHAARFKAIESTWRMKDGSFKDFGGCWIELTEEEVGTASFMLLFDDGERYVVPKVDFLQQPGPDA